MELPAETWVRIEHKIVTFHQTVVNWYPKALPTNPVQETERWIDHLKAADELKDGQEYHMVFAGTYSGVLANKLFRTKKQIPESEMITVVILSDLQKLFEATLNPQNINWEEWILTSEARKLLKTIDVFHQTLVTRKGSVIVCCKDEIQRKRITLKPK